MDLTQRRDLLKSGALILGAPAVLSAFQASKSIKIGLVGCGGRGTGAASQALKADDFSNLTAMADVFPERIDDSIANLKKIHGEKVKVEKANMFVGLGDGPTTIGAAVNNCADDDRHCRGSLSALPC